MALGQKISKERVEVLKDNWFSTTLIYWNFPKSSCVINNFGKLFDVDVLEEEEITWRRSN